MSKCGILVMGEFKTKAFCGDIDLPYYQINWKKINRTNICWKNYIFLSTMPLISLSMQWLWYKTEISFLNNKPDLGCDRVQMCPVRTSLWRVKSLFVWFNPGLPNFAHSFSRSGFTNQCVYILPKALIANIADLAMWPFSLAKVLHCCKNVSKRHTIAWHARLSAIHFFDKLCTVFFRNTELMDKDYIITS